MQLKELWTWNTFFVDISYIFLKHSFISSFIDDMSFNIAFVNFEQYYCI